MTVTTSCRRCGRKLRGKDEYAGKPTRCPACQTINRLPQRPDPDTPASGEASEVCSECGFDLSIDGDQVTDARGRRYHRVCYEAEAAEQAVQPPAASSSQPEQEPRQPEGVAEDLLSELLPDVPERLATGGDAQSTIPAAEPILLGPASSRSQRNWVYLLIGAGIAVPIVVLLFIVIETLTAPDHKQGQVADKDAAPITVDQTEENGWDTAELVQGEPTADGHERSGDSEGVRAAREAGWKIGIVVGYLIALVVSVVLLMCACSLCRHERPSFGRALAITLVMCVPELLAGLVIDPHENLELALLVVPLILFAYVVIASVGLRTGLGKAALILIVTAILGMALAVVLAVVLFIVIMAIPGQAG